MEYQQLKTFVQVCEMGSINRVSLRAGVAQPALSRQIKMLEAELGAPLFIRCKTGMKLTAAGKELLAAISGPLSDLEQGMKAVRALVGKEKHQVTVGMSPVFSSILAVPVTERITKDFPWISLHIIEGYRRDLSGAVDRHEIDAAVMHSVRAQGLLKAATVLLREPLLLVGPPKSPFEQTGSVGIAELSKINLILPDSKHEVRTLIVDAAREAQVDLDIRFEADGLSLIKDLIEAHFGYAILPACSIFRECLDGRLSHARITNPSLYRDVVMMTATGTSDNKALQAVTGVIKNEVRTLVESGKWIAELPDEPARKPRKRQAHR